MTLLKFKPELEPIDSFLEYTKDIARIRGVLAKKGLSCPDEDIARAWNSYSQDSLCISWLETHDQSDWTILRGMLARLEKA